MSGPFDLYKWQAAFRDFNIFFEGLLTTVGVGVLALFFITCFRNNFWSHEYI